MILNKLWKKYTFQENFPLIARTYNNITKPHPNKFDKCLKHLELTFKIYKSAFRNNHLYLSLLFIFIGLA